VVIDFGNLINLQKHDTEIRHISALLENIPFQITEIENKMKTSAQIIAVAKEKLALNQKKRKDLEGEVKDIKAKISKYKIQLNDVKTNREYSSLLKEIEEAQEKIDSLEEELISEMLSADEIEKEIKEANQKYSQEEKKFSTEKETINQEKKELETQNKRLTQEKEELLLKIPPPQTKLYLDIFKNQNGIALSPVKDEFCLMCHMRIRPQVLNELKSEEKLIFCENCGRILYWLKKSAR